MPVGFAAMATFSEWVIWAATLFTTANARAEAGRGFCLGGIFPRLVASMTSIHSSEGSETNFVPSFPHIQPGLGRLGIVALQAVFLKKRPDLIPEVPTGPWGNLPGILGCLGNRVLAGSGGKNQKKKKTTGEAHGAEFPVTGVCK
jgi:hypothetical protein